MNNIQYNNSTLVNKSINNTLIRTLNHITYLNDIVDYQINCDEKNTKPEVYEVYKYLGKNLIDLKDKLHLLINKVKTVYKESDGDNKMDYTLIDFSKIDKKLEEKLELERENFNEIKLALSYKFTSHIQNFIRYWEQWINAEKYCVNLSYEEVKTIVKEYNPDISSLIISFLDLYSFASLSTCFSYDGSASDELSDKIDESIENIIEKDFKSYLINRIYEKEKELNDGITNLKESKNV